MSANKPPDAYVIDVEGDGVDEVIVGVATGASPFSGTLVVVEDEELVDTLTSLDVQPAGPDGEGTSFGCVDLDGDDRGELISLRYQFSGTGIDDSDVVTWFRWPAGGNPDNAESGVFELPADRAAVETLVNGTCGDDVVIRVA